MPPASARRERWQLAAKLAQHLTLAQARVCVSALRSDSLVHKLVSLPAHCRKTPKELAEHVMSHYLNGQAAGRNVQLPQPSMPPARAAAPSLGPERSLLLARAMASFRAQRGATRWWVEMRLQVGAAGVVRVALQRSTALRLIDRAELQAVLRDRQDLLREVQPCVKLDGLMALMVKPCRQRHWEPASAVEVRNELELAQMVHTSGGSTCRTSLGIARLVVVGGLNLSDTYVVRDAHLLSLERIMDYVCGEQAAQEPQKVASAAAEMRCVIEGALQGLVQLHERGFAYNRSVLQVAFHNSEAGVQGVLLNFGRLTKRTSQLNGVDLQAAFNLFGQAVQALDFWRESKEYMHTWLIFQDSGSTLRRYGLRRALMVLNDMDGCYARMCERRQQQEGLRAAQLKLEAEHAERAARERQAALENAAERENMRHLYKDVTARRPTRAWCWLGQQPQFSSTTKQTVADLRAKRWREGKQTSADLRQVQGGTDVSEFLAPVLGLRVVERLQQQGCSTVELLLRAGADKAVAAVPIALPDLRERLRQLMAALRSHLGIHPKGSWGNACASGAENSERQDSGAEEDWDVNDHWNVDNDITNAGEDDGNEIEDDSDDVGSGSEEPGPSRKRAKK